MRRISATNPLVVVLVGADGLLVGTGTIRRHRLGGIPFTGARGLRDFAIHDQSMAVDHEHMAPVARLSWVSIGLAGQHRVGIRVGALRLVAELDASEITLGPCQATSAFGAGPVFAVA